MHLARAVPAIVGNVGAGQERFSWTTREKTRRIWPVMVNGVVLIHGWVEISTPVRGKRYEKTSGVG